MNRRKLTSRIANINVRGELKVTQNCKLHAAYGPFRECECIQRRADQQRGKGHKL